MCQIICGGGDWCASVRSSAPGSRTLPVSKGDGRRNIQPSPRELGRKMPWFTGETRLGSTTAQTVSADLHQKDNLRFCWWRRKENGWICFPPWADRGDIRFMLYEDSMNQQRLIQLMDRLVRTSNRKLFLILDSLRVHQGKKSAVWLDGHRDKIELFFLPPYVLRAILMNIPIMRWHARFILATYNIYFLIKSFKLDRGMLSDPALLQHESISWWCHFALLWQRRMAYIWQIKFAW